MSSRGARWVAVLAGLATLGLLPGCAQLGVAQPEAPASSPTGQLVGRGLVLDDGSGPELCLGVVLQSLPPQCGDLPLVGWTWPSSGVERSGGVTWGSFAVVGTYDGKRFTLMKIITPEQAEPSFPVERSRDFASPCSEPVGGWRPVDPSRSDEEDQAAAFELAARLPNYGRSWVDDRGDANQPPETTVVNVQVTGDVAAAERQLRTVWGGPLCVSTTASTERDRRRIAETVGRGPGLLGVSYDEAVDLEVIYDDGSRQRELDARYGPGVVRVHSALQPYRG